MTDWNQNKNPHSKVVGLLPAGGKAKRIAPLPCSKELFPVGFQDLRQDLGIRPKVVSHYLLEKMRLASVSKVYIVLRKGKWDIPAYFGDGKMLDMHLAYLMMDLPFGVPYTLDKAYPFVQDSTVVFGFPDIIFQPEDAFIKLLAKQAESSAEIVLGLFPAHQPHKMDMVDLQADGRIRGIQIKPVQTNLRYTWIIAVWTPLFTDFMHELIIATQRKNDQKLDGTSAEEHSEFFVGEVIQAAANNGLVIESVVFSDGAYLDIGTPDDLAKAVGGFPDIMAGN
jgi:glucose-1-phosphate thymidylyltransferase